MSAPLRRARPARWLSPILGAVILLLPSAAAVAQEQQPNPFRFLRPWLERQLGGRDASRPDEPPPPPEPPAADGGAPAEPDIAGPETQPPEAEAAAADPEGPEPSGEQAAGVPAQQEPAPGAAELPPLPDEEEEPAAAAEGAAGGPASATGGRVTGTIPSLRDLRSTEDGPGIEQALATSPREEAPQPLRLAVLAGSDPGATIRDLAPLTDALGAAVGRPVEILPVASYGAMIDAQIQRRIDGGFYSAAAYAVAEAECRCLEPIVAPASADGTAAYHAIIVARPDSGIESAADLEGRTVAMGAADSIGARRMQLAGLMAEGIDPAEFGGVFTVGSAEEAVRLAAQDAVDAAFAWSSLSGDMASGYSRGTLADLIARGEIGAGDVSIVWRSPPIAHGPLAVLRSLPDAEKQALESLLLGLERSEPAAYDRLNPFYGGGYVAVEPDDYSGLAAIATQNVGALRLPEEGAEGSTPEAP